MFVPFKGSNGSKVSSDGLNEWNYFERFEPSCSPARFPSFGTGWRLGVRRGACPEARETSETKAN